jgi:hypothetical protein
MDATPVVSTFRFIEDFQNRITTLVIQEQGRPARTAIKLNFQRTEIKIQSSEIALAGELISSVSSAAPAGYLNHSRWRTPKAGPPSVLVVGIQRLHCSDV